MLSLIHNLRFDRSKANSKFSFKKELNNYNTTELASETAYETLDNKILSSHWLTIYRKQ